MEQALALDELVGKQTSAIGSRLSLASMYLVQEEFAAGNAILREALAQARAAGHPLLTVMALLKLAGLQEDLNSPAAAIEQYEMALDVL